jgi:hypothetical protein
MQRARTSQMVRGGRWARTAGGSCRRRARGVAARGADGPGPRFVPWDEIKPKRLKQEANRRGLNSAGAAAEVLVRLKEAEPAGFDVNTTPRAELPYIVMWRPGTELDAFFPPDGVPPKEAVGVPELTDALKRAGAKVNGGKDELYDRAMAIYAPNAPSVRGAAADASDAEAASDASRAAGMLGGFDRAALESPNFDWGRLRRPQMQDIAEDLGVSRSGRKDQLLERIRQALRSGDGDTADGQRRASAAPTSSSVFGGSEYGQRRQGDGVVSLEEDVRARLETLSDTDVDGSLAARRLSTAGTPEDRRDRLELVMLVEATQAASAASASTHDDPITQVLTAVSCDIVTLCLLRHRALLRSHPAGE